MGSASSCIWMTLTIPDEDRNNYLKVKEAVKLYVRPRVYEVFVQYVFTQRCQEEGGSSDHFFTSLCQLVKTKDAESAENNMLLYQIVHGVLNKALQEASLQIDNLTLKCEQSKQVHLIHNKSGESVYETSIVGEVK
ncbi:hypothetical protein PR048_005620 [Dryococelus australis]|uniref:Uncharacterized protein n=1 Tax=Dryococelus australis TaxID=614101 RepID=A0ABQ9I8Q5_9NEOP|nr:hypothetical protein PR048_005620 [Dryococelus australis]